MAIQQGADLIGLVADMPSGPGVIDEATIALITKEIPFPVVPVLLSASIGVEAIVHQVQRCRVSAVQLVREWPPQQIIQLRQILPWLHIIQVIHVDGPDALRRARLYHDLVDALLLDSGRPNAAIAELGGTGRTHDWSTSRCIASQATIPVFLAGGLNQHNVREAVRQVRPWGVDLCSGVRTPPDYQKLDYKRLQGFMQRLQS